MVSNLLYCMLSSVYRKSVVSTILPLVPGPNEVLLSLGTCGRACSSHLRASAPHDGLPSMELQPFVPGLFPSLRYPHPFPPPFRPPCRRPLGKPAALEDIPLLIGGRTPYHSRRWEFLHEAGGLPGKVGDRRRVAAAAVRYLKLCITVS